MQRTRILSYILLALAKCKKETNTEVTFAELFCADGYYAMVARQLGVTKSIGIDNNRDSHFTNAELIAKRLGVDNCIFVQMDVNNIENVEPVDIVANVNFTTLQILKSSLKNLIRWLVNF